MLLLHLHRGIDHLMLDYFQERKIPPDLRIADAVYLIKKKRRPDGTWALQNKHPGRV